MAQVVYNPLVDYWEIFRLANGNHVESYLDSLGNLINNTVTQAALDQAVIDNVSGIKSQVQLDMDRESAVSNITFPDVIAAISGDLPALDKLKLSAGLIPGVTITDPSILKHNYVSTVAPTVLDDSSLGYSHGSHWYNTVSNKFKICVNASVGSAVWRVIYEPPTPTPYLIASVPKLTPLPTFIVPIPITPSSSVNITTLSNTMIINTSGIYKLDYICYVEGSGKKSIYVPTLYINNVANPIDGTITTNKDNTGGRFPSFGLLHKTLHLIVGDIVELKHASDDGGGTYSADISLVKIA